MKRRSKCINNNFRIAISNAVCEDKTFYGIPKQHIERNAIGKYISLEDKLLEVVEMNNSHRDF